MNTFTYSFAAAASRRYWASAGRNNCRAIVGSTGAEGCSFFKRREALAIGASLLALFEYGVLQLATTTSANNMATVTVNACAFMWFGWWYGFLGRRRKKLKRLLKHEALFYGAVSAVMVMGCNGWEFVRWEVGGGRWRKKCWRVGGILFLDRDVT